MPSRAELEARYPARSLPDDAIVTRSAPSPTGFMHIGTAYMCLLNQYLARQSGGVYMLRIEDTDKKREIEGGVALIVDALRQFDLVPDEGVDASGVSYGEYGPYLQSERKDFYLTFALELLQSGRAYPCFASAEELEANIQAQRDSKVRPGYYGKWALWRDKSDEDVQAALDAGKPFVLRFRSLGSHESRVNFTDVLKGDLSLPQNDLDVPLIKADSSGLPTYHLAHIVDDYLMKSTIILRGDEWLPSTPLHIELAEALGITSFNYAHFAPISVIDKNGGGKRKLSKRKDPEADVKYWTAAGYPLEGIKAYLLGLANSNFEEWYREHPGVPLTDFTVSLDKLAASRAPLLDLAKLQDYCKDVIATLPQDEFETRLLVAQTANPAFLRALQADPDYTHEVLSIERSGDKPRKDLAAWGEAYDHYGYFFDDCFAASFVQQIADELAQFDAETVAAACREFAASYDPQDEQPVWFDKLKAAATACGFATDNKAYKAQPDNFKGNVADFAKIIRVKLTGKNRTPDLWTIMRVMGAERVTTRLK